MRFRKRSILFFAAATAMAAALCIGCASVGSPDGGRYDETPPVFTGSSPKRNATNVSPKTVTLEFDEIVKIENAAEKVVVSPPLSEQPEIQINNRKIQIRLNDTLQSNTTYSIDFADAIVDNNEGNPLGDFCFNFATGDRLDTMEMSGYVLNASNLEPVKGILVGIYSNTADSAFTSSRMERISHTDSEGHFVIRGVAPGSYRVYALQDMDQDYKFSQKSEMIAWLDSLVVPSSEQRFRDDTIKNEKGVVDSVLSVRYTRFMPDNIVLRAFKERPVLQYISEFNRKTHEKFYIKFAILMDTLPELKGLNFDSDSAFIIERNLGNDSIIYWMYDSLLYYRDTLNVTVAYPVLDSTGVQVSRTDTLRLVPQKTRARLLSDAAKKAEAEAKEREKELRRLEKQGDSIGIIKLFEVKTKFLDVNLNVSGTMDLDNIVNIGFTQPVLPFIPDSAIHVTHKVDSIFEPMRIVLRQDTLNIKQFRLYAEWRPEEEYCITIDSAAIYGIYGLHNDRIEQQFKVNALNQYSTFTINVQDPMPGYTVQLYTGQDKIERTGKLENGAVTFYLLTPGKYYVRLFDDVNGNGMWDTGDYASKLQPEPMFYLNKQFELKQNWEHETEPWDVYMDPLFKQKPDDAKTQKSEARKEKKSKNAERDEQIAEQKAKQNQKREDRKEKRLERKKESGERKSDN